MPSKFLVICLFSLLSLSGCVSTGNSRGPEFPFDTYELPELWVAIVEIETEGSVEDEGISLPRLSDGVNWKIEDQKLVLASLAIMARSCQATGAILFKEHTLLNGQEIVKGRVYFHNGMNGATIEWGPTPLWAKTGNAIESQGIQFAPKTGQAPFAFSDETFQMALDYKIDVLVQTGPSQHEMVPTQFHSEISVSGLGRMQLALADSEQPPERGTDAWDFKQGQFRSDWNAEAMQCAEW